MRVRGILSCAAAAGVVLTVAGCGGDDGGDDRPVAVSVPVVRSPGTTVTTTATVTVPSTSTTPVTVTRRAPSPTTKDAPTRPRPAGPAPRTVTRPAPPTTTAKEPDDDSDPVGGTTFSLGPGRGTGYSVRVPDGWFDGSRRLEGSGLAFDLYYVRGRGSDVTSNILIARKADAARSGQDIGDLSRRVRRDVQATARDATVSRGPDATVDGDRAITFVLDLRVGGRGLVQRKVAVLHRGALYTAALTSLRPDAAADEAVFRAFLRSWHWQ